MKDQTKVNVSWMLRNTSSIFMKAYHKLQCSWWSLHDMNESQMISSLKHYCTIWCIQCCVCFSNTKCKMIVLFICYYTLLLVLCIFLPPLHARLDTTCLNRMGKYNNLHTVQYIKICDRHINHEINDGGVTTYYSFK